MKQFSSVHVSEKRLMKHWQINTERECQGLPRLLIPCKSKGGFEGANALWKILKTISLS